MSRETKPRNNSCPECGNNPVPHFFNWYFESLNIFLTPIRQSLLGGAVSRWLKVFAEKINLPWLLVNCFHALGVVRFQPDISKCRVRRAQVLWEEAQKRGTKFQELTLFGRPFDTYLAMKGNSRLVFSGLPRPKTYSLKALDILDDKVILNARFKKAGLPAPQGGSAKTFSRALRIFNSILKPVIVKPRAGSRGRHSTTFISRPDELKRAFAVAKQLCFWVVVEEQLFGPVYRATVVNYQLAGVLRGDSPQVAGDGIHTVQELINLKNRQAHPGTADILAGEKMEKFLSRQNFSLASIPPAGQTVSLSEKIGVAYGGGSAEEFDLCHRDNRQLFAAAARLVGDPLVGFDFIIPDITRSFREQRCGFIEANSLPFINLHHDPLFGRPRNVAAEVWDMVGF